MSGTIDDYLDKNISVEISYFHYDNLGSARMMTDASGKVLMDQDYLPFGGDLAKPGQIEVQNNTDESYKYTGQKEVVSISLYYYGARYYNPSIGRFTREDTYRGELDQPQSQHLYVYVMNNPLRYIDPTGHSAEEGQEYEIEEGDTLSEISLEQYGSPEFADLIAEVNDIDDPDKIIAGTQIMLPVLSLEDINNDNIDKLKDGNLLLVKNSLFYGNPSNSSLFKANEVAIMAGNNNEDGQNQQFDHLNALLVKAQGLNLGGYKLNSNLPNYLNDAEIVIVEQYTFIHDNNGLIEHIEAAGIAKIIKEGNGLFKPTITINKNSKTIGINFFNKLTIATNPVAQVIYPDLSISMPNIKLGDSLISNESGIYFTNFGRVYSKHSHREIGSDIINFHTESFKINERAVAYGLLTIYGLNQLPQINQMPIGN